MTPFEEAGYTKETKFRVLTGDSLDLFKGDIVTLKEDYDSESPYFITEDGRTGYLFLPGEVFYGDDDLEVYKGD